MGHHDAHLNALVTDVLGHSQYVAQGGDIGSEITTLLAHGFPQHVKAIHLNFVPWGAIAPQEQTAAEKAWFEAGEKYMAEEFDYMRMQVNKPMMPAVALSDSPLGTAAWLAEKFWAWADHGGNLDSIISKDKLLTNVMLYLLSESGIEGTFRFYRAIRDELQWKLLPGRVSVPTSVALYPKENPMGRPSLETAKRWFNVTRHTRMPRGGHFAALEQPQLFVQDLRDSFMPIR